MSTICTRMMKYCNNTCVNQVNTDYRYGHQHQTALLLFRPIVKQSQYLYFHRLYFICLVWTNTKKKKLGKCPAKVASK